MIVHLNKKKVDTSLLTHEELQGLLVELNEATASIEQQIRRASVHFYETGERADSEWFSKAQKALSKMRHSKQELQIIIGMKRKNRKPLPEHFVDVASEYLDDKDFERLMLIARKRKDAAEGEGVRGA